MRELPLLACDSVALNLRSVRQTQHRVPVRPRALWMDTAGRWLWQYSKRRTSQALWTLPELERALAQHAPWQPGDVVYVRECWAPEALEAHAYDARRPWSCSIQYRTDGALWAYEDARKGRGWYIPDHDPRVTRWRPSIHMPKWAARTWLKVKRVWVERVQDISEEDARAEGAPMYVMGHGPITQADLAAEPGYWSPILYRDGFSDMWESIYAGSWERNDWLWCCELELDRERLGVAHG